MESEFYHVWFSTKRRKDAFGGELGQAVKALLRETATRARIHLL